MAEEPAHTPPAGTRKLEALDPLLHPQDRDVLHQKSQFVDHFYDLVTESIVPPFSISIDGLWGSGKTTIMQMLENRLNARWKINDRTLSELKEDGVDTAVLEQLRPLKAHVCHIEQEAFLTALTEKIGKTALARYQDAILTRAQTTPYPTFWFNPWKYQDAENIVLAFLQDLSRQAYSTIEKGILKGLKLLNVLGLLGIDATMSRLNLSLKKVKDIGELVEQDRNRPSENYTDVLKEIEQEFRTLIQKISKARGGKPVIIFFDDLDRCLPDKAIQLLEAVKNLFVVKETPVIFVCGIDTHIVKQFIRSHYNNIKEGFAINYFRKIFNLTFSMPSNPPVHLVLREYIQQLMGWDDELSEKLGDMIATRGLQAEMTSIRKFLNVVNNLYTFQKFNPHYHFDPEQDFVVHLLLLKEAWEPVYQELIQEALKNRTETVEWVVSKVINNLDVQKQPLSKEKEEFLQNFMVQPFGETKFYQELEGYPTLP